jgi:hypothetical protein
MKRLERDNRAGRNLCKEGRSQVLKQRGPRVSAHLAARKEEAIGGR